MQDHSFYLQTVVQIERAVAGLEGELKHLQVSGEKRDVEIGKLTEQVTRLNENVVLAKGALKVVAWLVGVIGALIIAIVGSIAGVVVHHFLP